MKNFSAHQNLVEISVRAQSSKQSSLDFLKKEEENSNKPDSLSRIDNLNEFIESLKEFENIEGFLEHVCMRRFDFGFP